MIIGGQAVLVHGEPRYTRDIDITLAADVDRVQEILKLSMNLNLKVIDNPDEFVRKTMVLPAEEPSSGIKVDFIFSSSEFEREAIKKAISVKIGRRIIKFAALEDLIIHKVIANRPRDIEDVRILLLKNPRCNVDYIKSWLRKFDASLDENHSRTFSDMLSGIADNK
jgi:hypothetical protein